MLHRILYQIFIMLHVYKYEHPTVIIFHRAVLEHYCVHLQAKRNVLLKMLTFAHEELMIGSDTL